MLLCSLFDAQTTHLIALVAVLNTQAGLRLRLLWIVLPAHVTTDHSSSSYRVLPMMMLINLNIFSHISFPWWWKPQATLWRSFTLSWDAKLVVGSLFIPAHNWPITITSSSVSVSSKQEAHTDMMWSVENCEEHGRELIFLHLHNYSIRALTVISRQCLSAIHQPPHQPLPMSPPAHTLPHRQNLLAHLFPGLQLQLR